MLLLWRQDEGHRCCHGHLLTGPSRLTAGAPAARAAAPKEAADRVVGHSVDHVVKIFMTIIIQSAHQSAQETVGAGRSSAL